MPLVNTSEQSKSVSVFWCSDLESFASAIKVLFAGVNSMQGQLEQRDVWRVLKSERKSLNMVDS